MAATNLSAEFAFEDGDSRVVTFGPYQQTSTAVNSFKANVMQFNDNIPSDFKQNFLSNDGASCTGIIAATITTTEKSVIFAKSAEYASRALASNEEVSEDGNS